MRANAAGMRVSTAPVCIGRVRNEYVHIGVILREQGSREAAEVRFTRDWRRVRCLIPMPTLLFSKAWKASCVSDSLPSPMAG